MHFTVALSLRNRTALDILMSQLSNPHSPNYGKYLSQSAFNAQFAPTPQAESTVSLWLQSNGLRVTRTYPNRLLLDVTGTMASVDAAFQVDIHNYVVVDSGHTRTFHAPASLALVPRNIASLITGIVGLSSYQQAKLYTNGTTHGQFPYYPQDYANAYDLSRLWSAGYTGLAAKIAIVLPEAAPSDSILQQFETATGATVATRQNGTFQDFPIDGGNTEELSPENAIDVEYSSALAPSAKVTYYDEPNTSQGLLDALNTAGSDINNNNVISSSWAEECEPGAADPFIDAASTTIQSNTATGHTYVFASGDSGSTCGVGDGVYNNASYPSDDPYVLSVGGTAFSNPVIGGWPGEVAWPYCGSYTCGARTSGSGLLIPRASGGGYSHIFQRYAWQVSYGLPSTGHLCNNSSLQCRAFPDVAAAGYIHRDSNSNVIADTLNSGALVCWEDNTYVPPTSHCDAEAGTSLAAPMWAGMLADIGQFTLSDGHGRLGFVNPALYDVARLTTSMKGFHDITSGSNGSYRAGVGWDPVTGLGSPDVYNLAFDIVALSFSATYAPANQPASFSAGGTVPITITLRNTGSETWADYAGQRIYSSVHFTVVGGGYPHGEPWARDNHCNIPGYFVGLGQTVTFVCNVTAPSTTGAYVLEYQLARDDVNIYATDWLDTRVTVY